MNQEILCTWLSLPKNAWPPDPWTLLGLTRDVNDLSAIEKCVEDRMTKLRHYQLSYPEEATEGMNRLAEAFITVTQACGPKPVGAASDVQPAPTANGAVVSKDDTSIIEKTKIDWRDEPPPVRQEQETASSPEVLVDDDPDTEVLASKPFLAPTKVQRRLLSAALVCELAQESEEATSNMATIEAVIERVEITRRLLYAWEKVGKQLKATAKKVHPKDGESFSKRMQSIADIMQHYPAFLGHPGKPGYRVVVQARLKMPLTSMRALTPDQREALLIDWQDGQQVLLVHRKYLHKLFKSMRRRSSVGLALHAVRVFLNEHPRTTIAGIGFVALLVVVCGLLLAMK